MKVAILSESSADEAAIRILIDGILGSQAQSIDLPKLRTRGWPSVLNILPTILKHLHFQTDAEALVVVVDSDKTPVHQKEHDELGKTDSECRLCRLREVVSQIQSHVQSSGRTPIKTAVGMAVPQIEAWYRCGRDQHVTEAAWIVAMKSKKYPYDKNSLKRDVYGTDRPSIELETKFAIEEANRLVEDLDLFEKLFPNGFGALANDVRGW